MATSPVAVGRHRTAARGGLLSGLLAAACASAPATAPALPAAEGVPADALRIRLAFGEEADLDLFVTDPAQETVYFGNTPSSASGGVLEADLRCDAPAPRVETLRFDRAPAGRYRVGVDFPARCRAGSGPVPFTLVAESGAWRREERGEIRLGEFLPVALELEWPPGPSRP